MTSPRPSLLRVLQHHQTFIRILISLICLCIGSMTISTFFLYSQFSRSSVQEIGNNVQVLLEEKAASLAYIMNSVSLSALRTSADPDMMTYALSASTDPERDLMTWQKLKQAKQDISFADSIYLVNTYSGQVLDTNSGLAPMETFYDQEGLELMEQVESAVSPNGQKLYVKYFVRKLDAVNNTLPVIRNYITIVLMYETGAPGSAMIVNLDADFIHTYFTNTYESSNGDIVILNEDQQIISSPDPVQFLSPGTAHWPLGGPQSGWRSDHSEDLLHVYAYLSFSGISDWVIAQTIPIDQVFMNVRKTQTVTIWFYCFILIAALIVGWMVSRKLYSPIRALVKDATVQYAGQQTPVTPDSRDLDEFTLVTSALRHQKMRISELTNERLQSRQASRNHFLKDLLTYPSQYDQAALGEQFRKHGLSISNVSLAMILLRIDGYQQFLGAYNAFDQGLLRYAAGNIVEEVLGGHMALEMVDMRSDHLVAIVDAVGDHTEELQELSRVIQSRVEEFLSLSLTVVISDIVESSADLHHQYVRTFEHSNERFLKGPAHIHLQHGMTGHALGEPSFQYPEEIERLLMNELRLGHEKEALQHFDRLIMQLRAYSFANARLAIMMLLVNFSKTIHQMDLDTDIPATGSLTQLDNLLQQLETIEAFADWMAELLRNAIRTSARQTIGNNRNQELIAQIIQLVQEDLTNPNLSTKSIADALKLSVIYVRQSFKEATKQSLSDYINEQRLEKVTELLRNTELPMEEIAARTGFSAMNSFYTIFKRKLGRTPTQYRNS
ncbi:helix-turn-helix domain-containing protein [Paenibacillus sp. 1P07SE]|uniref:helix-turn-helix domain-containing protein n=1 Tax=Paenibacillus sp. 1P07SE TaxID=3132209 RepID=UPI0039A5AA69